MNKKAFALVALFAAVVFAGSTRSASAATAAELQAQINALLAQIAQIQGQGSSVSCYAFTRDLTVGVTGEDVVALQNYLKSTGHFPVTTASTGYFGPITQASVAAWQSANGVVPPAGYFGAISRAKYNAMCSIVVVVPPTTGDDDDDDSSGDDDDDTLSGGEADLNNFEASSGDDGDVEEGASGDVFEFEVDVDDGDVRMERVDLMFSLTSAAGDDEPWEVFDEIILMLDGEEVGTVDGSDEDNWDEDADDEYRLRFTDIDSIVNEDETAEFSVNVALQGNIDDVDDGIEWTLWVAEEGIRALDGEGIDHTIGDADELADATDEVAFDIDVEGEGEELSVSESDENPEATVLEVEDDSTSDWMTTLGFTLEAEGNDIEVNELTLRVVVSSSTYATLVDDAMLVIDGEEFDDVTVTASTTLVGAFLVFEFDSGDLVISEDDEVDAELMLRFNELALGNEGVTVTSSMTSADVDDIEAEGADDLGTTQLSGSANGDAHTLRTEGISLASGDATADVEVVDGATNDQAQFSIEFEVSAFGEDFYIPFGAATTTAQSDEGVSFSFLDDSNDVIVAPTGTFTASLDSSAGEDDGAFVVREGDTETFTLEVTYTPGTVGSFKLQLEDVFFRLDGVADSAADAQAALPEEDYRTGSANVNG